MKPAAMVTRLKWGNTLYHMISLNKLKPIEFTMTKPIVETVPCRDNYYIYICKK